MEYARRTGAPGLLEVNAPHIEEQARHRGLAHQPAAEEAARRGKPVEQLMPFWERRKNG